MRRPRDKTFVDRFSASNRAIVDIRVKISDEKRCSVSTSIERLFQRHKCWNDRISTEPFYDNLSYEEIAEGLGVEDGTVSVTLTNALDRYEESKNAIEFGYKLQIEQQHPRFR